MILKIQKSIKLSLGKFEKKWLKKLEEKSKAQFHIKCKKYFLDVLDKTLVNYKQNTKAVYTQKV